jgi:phosphoribosylformimino-5-aminoimidazole carboxamide ribotide isomerase
MARTMSFVVYPAVDISDGKCVRLLQGQFGTETVYSDDPVEVALGFCRAGARWLHIVDLDGAKTGVPANRELVVEVVKRASCPVQAGGGLRSEDEVTDLLAAGANRVVIGTMALDDEVELKRICARYGERIAVSLDARGGELSSHGWTVGSGVPLLDAVRTFEEAGASMFVYTDVGRDGTMSGPNVEGVSRVASATALPVIASGGVSSIEDLRSLARLFPAGVVGAVIGRALYDHKFGVMEAQRVADEIAAGREQPPPLVES